MAVIFTTLCLEFIWRVVIDAIAVISQAVTGQASDRTGRRIGGDKTEFLQTVFVSRGKFRTKGLQNSKDDHIAVSDSRHLPAGIGFEYVGDKPLDAPDDISRLFVTTLWLIRGVDITVASIDNPARLSFKRRADLVKQSGHAPFELVMLSDDFVSSLPRAQQGAAEHCRKGFGL